MVVSGNTLFAAILSQTPSNLICVAVLVTLSSLTQFQSKVRATKMKKGAKTCFPWQLLFRLFAEVEVWY